jgi:hypothetical protein
MSRSSKHIKKIYVRLSKHFFGPFTTAIYINNPRWKSQQLFISAIIVICRNIYDGSYEYHGCLLDIEHIDHHRSNQSVLHWLMSLLIKEEKQCHESRDLEPTMRWCPLATELAMSSLQLCYTCGWWLLPRSSTSNRETSKTGKERRKMGYQCRLNWRENPLWECFLVRDSNRNIIEYIRIFTNYILLQQERKSIFVRLTHPLTGLRCLFSH